MNDTTPEMRVTARQTQRDARVIGIVLAAGRATRMAGSKVVRPVRGQPMVERVVDAALESRLADTVVVVGHEADRVREVRVDVPYESSLTRRSRMA